MAKSLGAAPRPAPLPPGGNFDLDHESVWQARIDLAACFREAARLGLHEGICNHFSCVVPGRDDLFIVNPYGWGFEEITASRLLICDFDGHVVAGDGEPEATAFYIHARVHRNVPRARVCLHTHMPNATALTMVEGPPLLFAGQSSLKFYGRTAVDDDYSGIALDTEEGDRIAASLGDADIVFMRHHGVMVVGANIAEAWDDLYYLERACAVQRLAEGSGRPIKPIEPAMAARTARQMTESGRASAHAHLQSVKRQLDRSQPDYKT